MPLAARLDAQPFQINPAPTGAFRRGLLRLLRPAMERLLHFPALNRIYHDVGPTQTAGEFCRRALAELDIRVNVTDADLARIPRTGPLIVAANHPFGGIDGMILTDLLQRVRPDARLLVNQMLDRLAPMRQACLFVDPFGGPDAARRNLASMRSAMKHVKDGGALAMFPAGEVSHIRWNQPHATDPAWNTAIARLVQSTGATVIPLFFHGRNSMLFQFAGLLHPRLRTALLPHEILNKKHCEVRVEIGSAIKPQRMAAMEYPAELTAYLRARTYLLAGRAGSSQTGTATGAESRTQPVVKASTRPAVRREEPVIAAISPDAMEAEIAALPASAYLNVTSEYDVMIARTPEIPSVLREIGRLREITFRQVGEGTGRSVDLDAFDEHYLHLFVWQRAKREVVGAYRLGLVDEILPRHGRDGLYTSTLFRFSDELLAQFGPAIEMGRSFVRPEYQKEYAPLLLLWKGIGAYVAAHPHRRKLFGPVSVSNEFQSTTRQLLIEFLRTTSFSAELGRWVSPRNPPRRDGARLNELKGLMNSAVVRDMEQVGELVAEIESDRRGVPVLLRQYLKLNAKVLGFNIDPDFGDVLDALMLVDLTEVEKPILSRYMGKECAEQFLAQHGR